MQRRRIYVCFIFIGYTFERYSVLVIRQHISVSVFIVEAVRDITAKAHFLRLGFGFQVNTLE
jgi:hypothetical protein